ncbi:Ras-related protein Ral [Acrasis kona]|uniref:Ras-related protein Ral n=1 Tax=Acrasis kona TaxID=1008807 RepID=A0AAW2Z1M7_9EUKA
MNDDVLGYVASFVNPEVKEVLQYELVSRQFRKIFEGDVVWSGIWSYNNLSEIIDQNFKFCFSQIYLYLKANAKKRKNSNDPIKIVLFGPAFSGKSSLVVRFIVDAFLESYDYTIEDAYSKSVTVLGEEVLLYILDTSGLNDFASLRQNWIRFTEYILLCYDCQSQESFTECREQNYKFVSQSIKDCVVQPNLKLHVVECKRDTPKRTTCVDQEQGILFAESIGASFTSTSALSRTNVVEVFKSVAVDSMIPQEIFEKLKKGEVIYHCKKKKKESYNKCSIISCQRGCLYT